MWPIDRKYVILHPHYYITRTHKQHYIWQKQEKSSEPWCLFSTKMD
jgi:hypothetical protein